MSAAPSPFRPGSTSIVGRESAIGFSVQVPPRRRPWRWILKILYALATGAFACWLVSFTPVESPGPLSVSLPHARARVYIPSGRTLLNALLQHRLSAEVKDDADARAVVQWEKRLNALRKEYRKLPGLVRDLVPFSVDGLFPFVGEDLALSVAEAPGGCAQFLVVTRVVGYRGQLARIAAWASPRAGAVTLHALGGDLVAVSVDGAPVRAVPDFYVDSTAQPLALAQFFPLADGVSGKRSERDWRRTLPEAYLSEYEVILPESVKQALARPPTVLEMLGQVRPSRIDVGVWLTPDGHFAVAGESAGPAPSSNTDRLALKPSAQSIHSTRTGGIGVPYVEALLPVSVRHIFLALAADALAGRPEAMRLHKGQRRWTPRFARLSESGVSLDDDLFPAFGNTLQFAIQDPPSEVDTAGYGLAGMRIPFRGSARARDAFAAAMRAHYTETVERPGERATQIPYLRIQRTPALDRYVEATGQIHAPLWDVSADRIEAVSDAGPLALMRPEGVVRPSVNYSEAYNSAPEYWYARLDGVKLAPTVEKIATAEFDGLQEQLGAEEFLKEYPDSQAWIRMYGKCARALGEFSLTLQPLGTPGSLKLQALWKPGTLQGGEKAGEDAPPPPPLQ